MIRKRLAAALVATVAAVGIATTPGTAQAHHAPYGGCVEAWQAPQSEGAEDCREHGWTVRARLVVGPQRVVRYTALPHCRYEDGSGQRSACTWNVGPQQDGNGRGLAYWIDRQDRVHYVRR